MKILHRSIYTFRNGTVVEFVMREDGGERRMDVEWGWRKMNRERIDAIWEEYVTECIPKVFQRAADELGMSMLWVDPYGKAPMQHFEPRTGGVPL